MRILLVLLASTLWARLFAEQEPPSGYTWQELPIVRGSVLRPKGWFFAPIEVRGGGGYLISEEDISTGGDYQTGLKIKYVMLEQTAGSKASVIARKILQNSRKLGQTTDVNIGMTNGWGWILFEEERSVATDSLQSLHHFITRVYYHDPEILVFVSFDCPAEKWTEKKRFADVMFSEIRLLRIESEKGPNQSPEPTAMSVTPPAAQEPRQP
jgi:hypothetical protein